MAHEPELAEVEFLDGPLAGRIVMMVPERTMAMEFDGRPWVYTRVETLDGTSPGGLRKVFYSSNR